MRRIKRIVRCVGHKHGAAQRLKAKSRAAAMPNGLGARRRLLRALRWNAAGNNGKKHTLRATAADARRQAWWPGVVDSLTSNDGARTSGEQAIGRSGETSLKTRRRRGGGHGMAEMKLAYQPAGTCWPSPLSGSAGLTALADWDSETILRRAVASAEKCDYLQRLADCSGWHSPACLMTPFSSQAWPEEKLREWLCRALFLACREEACLCSDWYLKETEGQYSPGRAASARQLPSKILSWERLLNSFYRPSCIWASAASLYPGMRWPVAQANTLCVLHGINAWPHSTAYSERKSWLTHCGLCCDIWWYRRPGRLTSVWPVCLTRDIAVMPDAVWPQTPCLRLMKEPTCRRASSLSWKLTQPWKAHCRLVGACLCAEADLKRLSWRGRALLRHCMALGRGLSLL